MIDDICDHDKIIEFNVQIENIFELLHKLAIDISDVDSKVEVASSKIAQIKFDKAQETAEERSWLQRNTIGLLGGLIGVLVSALTFALIYLAMYH
jgi:hypothetical protein